MNVFYYCFQWGVGERLLIGSKMEKDIRETFLLKKKKRTIERHYGPNYILLVLKLWCRVKLNQTNLSRGVLYLVRA